MRGPPSAASDAWNRRSAASNPPRSLVRSLCSLTTGVRLRLGRLPFKELERGRHPHARPCRQGQLETTLVSQTRRRGSIPRGGTRCEVAQEAERPAVTREVGGSWPSLAAMTRGPDGKARGCNPRLTRFDSETRLSVAVVQRLGRRLARSTIRVRFPVATPCGTGVDR